MHMDELPGAGRLVQRIDVLRHGEDLAPMLAFEPCERDMRRIRLRRAEARAAEIVEFMHPRRIPREAARRRHRFEIELLPQAAFVAKRAEPAFRREPGSGKHNDVPESHRCHARAGGHPVTPDFVVDHSGGC
jgi:hypothetical protein